MIIHYLDCLNFLFILKLCLASLFGTPAIAFAQKGKNDIIPLCAVLLIWLFSQQRVSFDRGENSNKKSNLIVLMGLK